MKLECEADPRAWVEVVDVWTRVMLREFQDILSANDEEALEAYYRRVVKSVHIVDADGNEIEGLDDLLEFEDGQGMDNVDAAVAYFWGTLPYQAYEARQRLGNARRVS